jgi:hypothetical protein
MQCLSGKGGKGCGDLLRTKGSESERNNLLELEAHTTEQIARFETAVQSGEHGAANWYDHAKSTLAGVKFALAIDNDPHLRAGTQVRVFDSPSKNVKS